jgi:hypothetical protein
MQHRRLQMPIVLKVLGAVPAMRAS